MNGFTVIFLAALAAAVAIEAWLMRRHLAHVRAHRDQVPEPFRDQIALEAHQKAADYTLAKGRVSQWSRWLSAATLLLFTLGGGIEWLSSVWVAMAGRGIVAGIGVILSTLLLMHLIELPVSVYQTFSVEQRFGFNRTTPAQYAKDMLMQAGLSIALGAPLLALMLWVMDRTGPLWWLWAWAILMGFSILMSWAFPTFIAPLFNKFTPLQDQDLKHRIDHLLERCGFLSKGVFVMDGSRRSGHGNAYFTGIGNNKRIVFFDTLLSTLDHDEVEAVLAHELGHFKLKHVLKMLIASSAISFSGFALLGWLAGQDWFYTGLGVSTPSHASALLLFLLISPVFTIFLQPVTAYFQRRHEFEADDFAAGQTRASFLVSALVKLYRDNASTLTPDPLYSAFHYSHPPASIRIAHLSTKT
ncbi:M48 family metallopeptidase [Methylolobus aquaticus]